MALWKENGKTSKLVVDLVFAYATVRTSEHANRWRAQTANRNQIKFSKSEVITVGRTYKMNNGWSAKVDAIWCDKYGDSVRYTTNDGKCGDTAPNSFYYWVDWKASNVVAA